MVLLGRAIAERHELPCASGDTIVKAIGASKSQAYEVAGELAALRAAFRLGRSGCRS